MKINNPSRRATLLIAAGLLMTTLPLLFKEYIPIPDFFRGLLAGLGLTLEIAGFIWMKKNAHSSACKMDRQDA